MIEKADVYTRVTSKILADLERGNLTWLQPWQAGHQAGPVSRPLRAGGQAYSGINILILWLACTERGFSGQNWLTFRQALKLAHMCARARRAPPSSMPTALSLIASASAPQPVTNPPRSRFSSASRSLMPSSARTCRPKSTPPAPVAEQPDPAAGRGSHPHHRRRYPHRRQPRLLHARHRLHPGAAAHVLLRAD